MALKADGTVVAWGANWNGQCAIPATANNALAVAAGLYHTLVLVDDGLLAPRLSNPVWKSGQIRLGLHTFQGKKYVLEYKNSLADLPWTALSTNNGNGAVRILTDTNAWGAQRFYRVGQW